MLIASEEALKNDFATVSATSDVDYDVFPSVP